MNPEHLLEQAERLAEWQSTGRPRATDLRRAVSAAYYAVFHTFTTAASARISSQAQIRQSVVRLYSHAQMRDVARQFSTGRGAIAQRAVTLFGPLPAELVLVAEAFIDLQEARHAADYDPRRESSLRKPDAEGVIATARRARAAWDAVRAHPAVEFFLLALLLKDLGRFAD